MRDQETKALIRSYLQEIQNLLPILRREEKAYLRGMEQTIEDYISGDESPILDTLEDFHSAFGKPRDVVQAYCSGIEGDSFYSCIKVRRLAQKVFLALGVLFILFSVTGFILLFQEHHMIMRQETIYADTQVTLEENP